MIKFENLEVVGWEAAIRGMRNPKNSWAKSDSLFGRDLAIPYSQNNPVILFDKFGNETFIGDNDLDLMKRLRNAGTDHRKFMRQIVVYVDITAPLYWWKEFDTYKVGTVANSCSTMHKIADKEFVLDDFSHEHLIGFGIVPDHAEENPNDILCTIIKCLNFYRDIYVNGIKNWEGEYEIYPKDKKYWWQMIQLLPSSYNQKRTVMLNYEVLANIYKSRKNHKLDEWAEHKTPAEHEFRNKDFTSGAWGLCDWIKNLPYSELITGESLSDIPICNEIMEEAKKRVKE